MGGEMRRERSGEPRARPRVAWCALVVLVAVVGSTGWPDEVNAAQYTLTWTDRAQDEDGFRIERKRGATGPFLEIATVGPDATSFVDAGVEDGPTFCYRVRAFNVFGVSAPSNEACAPLTAVLDVEPGAAADPSVDPSADPSVPLVPPGQIRPGDAVEFSVKVSNFGPERLVDVHFGVLLPLEAGAVFNCPGGPSDAIVLFESWFTRTVPACLSRWSGPGEPLVRDVVIPGGLPPTQLQSVLHFVWPPGLPLGTYTFLLGIADAGRAQSGEWLALIVRTVIAEAAVEGGG